MKEIRGRREESGNHMGDVRMRGGRPPRAESPGQPAEIGDDWEEGECGSFIDPARDPRPYDRGGYMDRSKKP